MMTQKTWFVLMVTVAMVAFASVMVAPAMAQDGSAQDANQADDANEMAGQLDEKGPKTIGEKLSEAKQDFVKQWQVGGTTMWFLGFLGLIAFVFAVDRVITLRRGKIAPHGLAARANKLWNEGQYDQIVKLGKQSNSTLGKIIAFMAEHRENDFDHINTVAGEIAERDFSMHSRRTYPLAAVGTLSPLMGLMGTVLGLMGAFATINVVGTMDDPAALAGDIGKALVTTAGGLILALPALGLFHYFKSRTGVLASILGEEVSNLQNAWFLKKGGSNEG